MMLTTRCWGGTTVFLCALLLQNCQSNLVRATEEKEPAVGPASASAVRQRASSEPSAMWSLTPLSASPGANVSNSSLSTTSANQEDFSTAFSALAIMGNPLAALEMPRSSRKVSLGDEPGVSTTVSSERARLRQLQALSARSSEVDLSRFDGQPHGTFGAKEWHRCFGEVEPVPDLPINMAAILESACPFWPGKRVRDTHLLALIPAAVDGEPFTLNLLGELIQYPKNGGHKARYSYYGSDVQVRFGAASPAASYWLLMTRDVLPGSRNKSYRDQKELVSDHAERTSLPYEVPNALEAATVIMVHHVRNGEQLYGDDPLTFTRCQEWGLHQSSECPAIVGGFGSSGLSVHSYSHYDHHFYGIAGCRKFF
jgi:hypothetical protein